MRVVVHYPTTMEGKEELARRVSEVHSRAVVAHIAKLPINHQEKMGYLEKILATYT